MAFNFYETLNDFCVNANKSHSLVFLLFYNLTMKRNVNGYRWNDDRMQAIYINIVVNLFFVKIANYCLHPTHDLSVYGMGS